MPRISLCLSFYHPICRTSGEANGGHPLSFSVTCWWPFYRFGHLLEPICLFIGYLFAYPFCLDSAVEFGVELGILAWASLQILVVQTVDFVCAGNCGDKLLRKCRSDVSKQLKGLKYFWGTFCVISFEFLYRVEIQWRSEQSVLQRCSSKKFPQKSISWKAWKALVHVVGMKTALRLATGFPWPCFMQWLWQCKQKLYQEGALWIAGLKSCAEGRQHNECSQQSLRVARPADFRCERKAVLELVVGWLLRKCQWVFSTQHKRSLKSFGGHQLSLFMPEIWSGSDSNHDDCSCDFYAAL